MPPADLLRGLTAALESAGDADQAAAMSAYMRDQFPFYGIPAPVRKALLKPWAAEARKLSPPELRGLALDLWEIPQRESRYCAVELLIAARRQAPPDFLELYETLIRTDSWWDTVDLIAANLVGPLMRQHPALLEDAYARWIQSGNLWINRTALLFQLHDKQRCDWPLLQATVRHFAGHPDFFIRKAIGWALREYSKVDAEAVRRFAEAEALAPLSRAEALKWLEKRGL
ncbi:MAG: DNA alkylation repair protein [Bacteroidia bacterium]|nr:DNA alkylation repair protein [Bacteroidia bacterium]